jgi:predicted O-linked N-acetylglucosamine transferase (SPINDLY family)
MVRKPRRELTMSAAKFQQLLQAAVTHHRHGRLADADKLYARVRTVSPVNFDAFHLSGLLAYQQGRYTDAARLLRRGRELNPRSALCEMRLGLACAALGEAGAAEAHLRAAIALEPGLAEAWCHLGVALKTLGRLPEARAAYLQSLALKPDSAEAHDRLGALVSETAGFAEAVPHFRRAVALEPDNVALRANLGVALAQAGAMEEAGQCFNRVLATDPEQPLALMGRALVRQQAGRITEAIADYTAVLQRHPQHHEAHSGRLLARHYLEAINREDLFADHAAFGTVAGQRTDVSFPNLAEPHRRLRLAFLSPDLRAHSVAYFLEPLLANLDRGQFEIFLYHDHPRVDAMSERLRTHATQWRHFAGLSHAAVETAIRADAPDVLVDLAGHTGLNRLPLFARRLAPVQVTYLGYPNTTGLREMDYRFVDAVTDPVDEAEAWHTEQLVRFAPTAWSYAPPAAAPECAPPPSLLADHVTFGCFNNFSKVNDLTLRAWSQILAAVPGSRLLLKAQGLEEPAAAAALRARLAALGIDGARVELLGRTPGLAAHLAAYARMDIALDTFPYHGTTTTCEALWMGCPVVTLPGDRHASRVGASLLVAVNRPNWIARDWADYVRIAAELAHDRAGLVRERAVLRGALRVSPLLDHAGQGARFGAAVRACWAAWCDKQAGTKDWR